MHSNSTESSTRNLAPLSIYFLQRLLKCWIHLFLYNYIIFYAEIEIVVCNPSVWPFSMDKWVNTVTWINHFNFQLTCMEISCSRIPLFSIHSSLVVFLFQTLFLCIFLSWIMWGYSWGMIFILYFLSRIWVKTRILISAVFLFWL